MVADLALLHGDDISAILNELGPKERSAVEDLLREHAAYFDEAPTAPPPEPVAEFDPTRLSPWLVQRLHADASNRMMTAAARQALRDAAVRLYPLSEAMAQPRTGWFGRKGRAA
jgi:hypothetical protein